MKEYLSPAKVNLDLRVLGRREDGFHEVETLMVPLTLADTLTFELSESLALKCSYPGVPLDENNLVTKAVRALEQHSGRAFRYEITIDKKIPHGAGLAGGSSNAATTLLALNELEQLGLTRGELAGLAADMGADVAFFLYQSVCRCQGKGELVEPVEFDGEGTLLLVKPKFGVSTPDAYRSWQGSEEIEGIDYAPQQVPWGTMQNDLERPVFQKHRFLAELKMWLKRQQGVKAALMSGSGSTVFALLEGESACLVNKVKEECDPSLWVCDTKIQKTGFN